MFGIGVTLNPSEIQRTLDKKWVIVAAIVIKYVLMPLTAYLIGILLKLSLLELVGLVIIGACPGGTAANVMAYLGKANTTLTVVLTLGTTLIAPFVTPALIYFLLHKSISIPFFEILNTMVSVVLLPIALGVILKKVFVKRAAAIIKFCPILSIFSIALVIACVMALTQPKVLAFPLYIIIAVTALNLAGYLFGFITAKLLGNEKPEQRSMMFEYGMFDTGLGVVIATGFFGPLAALPGALLSIIQNLTAAIIVKCVRRSQKYSKQGFFLS